MEAEARYTTVGAGVLALLLALVASIVWLRGYGARDDTRLYTIRFAEQPLDGLEIGAEVKLRGIRVGRVEDFELDAAAVNRVRVDVRVDRRASVRQNTVAVVTRNLVTGIASITLVTPEPAAEALTEAQKGEANPVIGEGRSDLQELTGRVNQVGEAATLALTQLNQLLAAENRESLMQTVRSLRELADGVRGRLDTMDRTLQQVGAAATQVGTLAEPMRVSVTQLGQAGDRMAGVAERGGEQLGRTLVQAEQLMAESRTAVARLATAAETLERETQVVGQRLQGTADGIDEQLAGALSELRLSTDAAVRVLDRLRDPRASLLGPAKAQLGPGEQKP
jgi:phospholipid/cholesterol/gamma-HCH transport system substrate-binding protein